MPRLPRPALRLLPLLALACVPPGTRPDLSPPERLYTVAYGDTLWGVATTYGVVGGFPAIARANGIRNPHHIEAGDRLRLASADPSLPLVPRWGAAPPVNACAMQATAAWSMPATGDCVELRCVDTGAGSVACACQGPSVGHDRLIVSRAGGAAESLPVGTQEPWWFVEEGAPEPARSTAGLVGARVQLDDDPGLETVVSWRTHRGDVKMSQGVGLVVDHDGRAGPVFRLDQFGVGSAVQAAGRCDLLATEWELGDEEGLPGWGYYLGARRFTFRDGGLVPTEAPLAMRRLLHSYQPAWTTLGSAAVASPAVDLATAATRSRSTEPTVELPVIGTRSATIRSARRERGKLVLDLDGARTVVDPEGGEVVRLGDRATGRLYPSGYAPADDRSLRGKPAELRLYRTVWGEAFGVIWVG